MEQRRTFHQELDEIRDGRFRIAKVNVDENQGLLQVKAGQADAADADPGGAVE